MARSDVQKAKTWRSGSLPREPLRSTSPRRCPMPMRPSSRIPTPRRPNGTWRTRPGFRNLRPARFRAGYRLHDERWPYLFNSYYEGEGSGTHARGAECSAGRTRRSPAMAGCSGRCAAVGPAQPPPQALKLVELGIHHEQQHQELFLTDILATLAENPA